ncbi:MAG: DUF6318 family protein, partial [Galactobacter sp.]
MWLAPALGLVLVLSGCTGGPDPGKTFTPTASEKYVPPTPSSSGDASPSAGSGTGDREYQPATETSPAKNVPVPEYPEAAKANTEDGQKAFIEYWFKTYNYAFETGNAKPLEAVSGEECEFCQQAADKAAEIVRTNATWRTSDGAMPDLSTATHRGDTDGAQIWDVVIRDSKIEFWDSTGKSRKYEESPESESLGRFW